MRVCARGDGRAIQADTTTILPTRSQCHIAQVTLGDIRASYRDALVLSGKMKFAGSRRPERGTATVRTTSDLPNGERGDTCCGGVDSTAACD